MANPYFQFKQFTIRHDKCAMKVGTDGVLLGAWADTSGCQSILDVGTGTGLISLMLAQRSTAKIDAIDIDAGACLQAEENALASPFAGRIDVTHTSLAGYSATCTKQYDLIVSNPPYFIDSLKCPDQQRNTARHTDTLPLQELLHDCRPLLAPGGHIALILPYDQKDQLETFIQNECLFLTKETEVIPIPGAIPKRLLVELATEPVATTEYNQLTIEVSRHQYTDDYICLTRDFYLKM